MNFLGKLLGLGGLMNGSKTLLGALSLGYVALQQFAPEAVPFVDGVLQVFGVALLPIGVGHKVVKALQ